MKLVDSPITKTELTKIAQKKLGNLVKAVVDIKKGIMVIDADLHADEESHLLSLGSKQADLWGINLYPELEGDDFIEFDSMINVRPSDGNTSRGVDNVATQKQIRTIVSQLVA